GLKKSKEQQENGKGLSIAGIIMGSITIVGGLIFVMIAVIASFGVLNTSEMIPEKTTFGVPFISLDTAALNKNDGTIKVAFRNGKGNPIELITATNSGNVNLNQGTCDLAQISTDKTNVNNGETFVITWTCNDPGDIGDKISGDFSFSYKNTNTDITTEHKGKIYSSW
ncbi:DUF4190 domain-containing protein, partial [Candidatus Woesearchaeota archaeon]|nr:DUF4190 domain-containing protein [Candidatus Woesearchaeota archaeon]MCF8013991.1 DUF4190 domain-containing protein [Candidatus Woesearchaeota archaeon]